MWGKHTPCCHPSNSLIMTETFCCFLIYSEKQYICYLTDSLRSLPLALPHVHSLYYASSILRLFYLDGWLEEITACFWCWWRAAPAVGFWHAPGVFWVSIQTEELSNKSSRLEVLSIIPSGPAHSRGIKWICPSRVSRRVLFQSIA